MRLATVTLALALCVLGCGPAPGGEPVQLLTGVNSCYAGGEQGGEGVLVADPEYGTRFEGRPVVWPVGFTGVRLAGGEVAVLNAEGKVIATSGRRYYMSLAPAPASMKIGAFPVAANCPYAQDFREVWDVSWLPFAILFVVVALGFGIVWRPLRTRLPWRRPFG
jgi:hypothetical protein